MKTARITNRQVRAYVQSREPFKANSMYGRNLRNGGYAVFSYGEHWPLFAVIRGYWYENEDRYSVTTSRHHGQAHPYETTILESADRLRRRIADHEAADPNTAMTDYRAVALAEGFGEPGSVEEVRAAWQHLHDTGLAYQLQGWFGRQARALIEAGEITP